jgi:hypothetical protein
MRITIVPTPAPMIALNITQALTVNCVSASGIVILLPLTAQPLDQTVLLIVRVTGPGNVTVCVPELRPALQEYHALDLRKPAERTINVVEFPINAVSAVVLTQPLPIAIAFAPVAEDALPIAIDASELIGTEA